MRHSALCKWLVLPLSVLIVSCSQEKESDLIGKRELVISATQEATGEMDPQTRTVLVDGTNVHWSPQDQIMVFGGNESAVFTSSNTEAAATVQFSGTITLPSAGSYIWALYPNNSNTTMQGGTVTTTLPSAQVGIAGTFDDDLVILASRGVAPSASGSQTVSMDMTFKHVCSGVKFRLVRDDIKRVKLTSRRSEPVAGRFSFAWNNSGVPVVSSVTTPSTSVTVNAPSGEAFTPGVWYYIVTLPVEFTSGVTFTLTNTDNLTAERVIETGFTLTQGAFSSATDLDANIQFVEGGGEEPEPDEPDVEVQVAGPDTWVATDELKRELPIEIEGQKSGGQVIMFYWTWHTGQHGNYPAIVNIAGVQNTLGKLFFDAGDYTSNYFGPNVGHDPCFWGEPLFGYYRSTDDWVLRKHAEMLADAGVDAVAFDCTNGTLLWWDAVQRLLVVWNKAQQDGVNVPKIVFHLPFAGTTQGTFPLGEWTLSDLHYLYENLYKNNSYKNLWYYVDGHPLIMGYPTPLTSSAYDQTIRSFFTFRPGQGDYVRGGGTESGSPKWGWLQVYPQNMFNGEEMPVSVSQNASDYSQGHCYAFNSNGNSPYVKAYGRSYTSVDKNQTLLVERDPSIPGDKGSYIYGYNFQEQWDYALEKKPKYVFVTGWNEWNAARQDSWGGGTDGTHTWVNYPNSFPDQYDFERSRDIEPTCNWGDDGDNYYYQLIDNVRRFKGAGSYPNVTRPKTMAIDGDFDGWDKVSPDFKHYGGNTFHRNHGWQSNYGLSGDSRFIYTNNTGRNDFVDARVTRDADYVYFYVETKGAISARTDANWMRLLINIDRNINTGWKGYDFCLNYLNPTSDTQGIVSHATGTSWEWTNDSGDTFDYAISGNKMEIRVPRSVLGLSSSAKLDFEFKWCDNNLVTTEGSQVTRILNLYVDGDAAPGGRFNFHYKEPVE